MDNSICSNELYSNELKKLSESKYSEEKLREILSYNSKHPFFSHHELVYFFTLFQSNFSIDYNNYDSIIGDVSGYSDESLLYVCESIKLQILSGKTSFYFVLHKFFSKLVFREPLQKFFLFIMELNTYQIREYISSFGIVEKLSKWKPKTPFHIVFLSKFLVYLVPMRSVVQNIKTEFTIPIIGSNRFVMSKLIGTSLERHVLFL